MNLLIFWFGERELFWRLDMVDGLFRGYDTVADALLKVFSGVFGNLGAFFGHPGIFTQAFRIALLAELGGGLFGQRVQQQFHICHVVAEIFFGEAFEVFVFSGGHTAPCL